MGSSNDEDLRLQLAQLALPPGHRIQINYDPDHAPFAAKITVFRGEQWLGELTVATQTVDAANNLQELVDGLTKRGVHPL